MSLFGNEFTTLSSSEQAESFLDNLSDFELNLLEGDWVTQVWLYENDPPNTEEALKRFGPFSLSEEFRKAFINGDYKRITLGLGTTVEEGVFKAQIELGLLHACVLSESFPQELEIAFYKTLPHILLMTSYPLFIKDISTSFHNNKRFRLNVWKFPTLLIDGDLKHTIHVHGLSEDRKFIIYDEFWWKGHSGISFFSKGENSQNTSAELIDPLFNTFKVSQLDFWKFFIGFIMPRSGLRRWAYHVWQMKGALESQYPGLTSYNPLNLINNESLITFDKSEFGYI